MPDGNKSRLSKSWRNWILCPVKLCCRHAKFWKFAFVLSEKNYLQIHSVQCPWGIFCTKTQPRHIWLQIHPGARARTCSMPLGGLLRGVLVYTAVQELFLLACRWQLRGVYNSHWAVWSHSGLEASYSKLKRLSLVIAPQTQVRRDMPSLKSQGIRKPKAMAFNQIFTLLPGQVQFTKWGWFVSQAIMPNCTADISLLSGFLGNWSGGNYLDSRSVSPAKEKGFY